MSNPWTVTVWVKDPFEKRWDDLTIYSGKNPIRAFWVFMTAKKKHDTQCVRLIRR